jgi:hypothetical protein
MIKYTNIFHSKTHQNMPKLVFLCENKPSGNPDWSGAIVIKGRRTAGQTKQWEGRKLPFKKVGGEKEKKKESGKSIYFKYGFYVNFQLLLGGATVAQ